MRMSAVGASLIVAGLLAACSPSAPTAAPAQPLDTTEQKPPVADPSQPVASGNTPAAADVAAVAALNAQFDPARDPVADLATAKVEAQRGGKRIVLDVGGEWCSWCHLLDAFVEGDAEIRSFRDANYVWMKVNYSEDNENAAFLSQYPQIKGYPHLFVLDAQGTLLHSQFTGELEADKGQPKGYNREKFLAFMKDWAPPQAP
ncbi:thioredoxin family protein [Stenotrophomonas aracearum]|jgi:thiol-disulfide isomerase/thioredoxin|uniref:Thioredoxin family protein n=1 Tax=Stenotrophomonas aracearum TaxID=3003272 RepID=A0ABY9YC74_9GAMM|nr:thioredoxin family protein [Stenotrophomonas sp. A5588]WNH48463.1 thioredoxin family protein [Stenotrophomonas sp. A5588]